MSCRVSSNPNQTNLNQLIKVLLGILENFKAGVLRQLSFKAKHFAGTLALLD